MQFSKKVTIMQHVILCFMSICHGKGYKNFTSHTFNGYLYIQQTNIKVNAQNRGYFFYFHNMKATAVSSHLLQIQNVTLCSGNGICSVFLI